MAKNQFKNVSGKLLNSTERETIAKLTKLHQPILKEMEKWKDHREKLETTLMDQIEMIGKILKPYYKQSQETLTNISRRKLPTAPNKKSPTRKKSRVKKSRSR